KASGSKITFNTPEEGHGHYAVRAAATLAVSGAAATGSALIPRKPETCVASTNPTASRRTSEAIRIAGARRGRVVTRGS
ncbi:hypothetical protein, partial [Nocardioides sp. NPDC000441]|uniref:hypothetical protein n=1 Tax=Nocardioides sp. NPDC000441 TaxID=3154256 RepID=UPI00332AD600